MKKRVLSVFLALSLLLSLIALPVPAASPGETVSHAVYLGVQNYGTVQAADKDTFVHRFSVDGKT